MARVESTMLDLGTPAPELNLTDVISNQVVSLNDFADARSLLVIFTCNHCPFVKHVRPVMVKMVNDFQSNGVASVAINSNDVEKFPDDSPERMREEAKQFCYTFPYLFDKTQEVAKAYRAACTPEFYLFNKDSTLVYRGQMDESRPKNNIPVSGRDLREAVAAVLGGREVNSDQRPSLGCNIKWKPGNEPEYFNS